MFLLGVSLNKTTGSMFGTFEGHRIDKHSFHLRYLTLEGSEFHYHQKGCEWTF